MPTEFEEIAHSGGVVELTLHVDAAGNRSISFGWRHSRPVPAVLVSYYVLHPGLVIEPFNATGLGTPFPAPSVPGSIPMLLSSDSEGKFGHNCHRCSGYWRGEPWANFCPYCGVSGQSQDFLSHAQRSYAQFYCEKWDEAVSQGESGSIEINLDEIADSTLGLVERPAFYISDERQQTLLRCASCNALNDIIGRFGHCSECFTRNDLTVFEKEVVDESRQRMRNGESAERQLKEIISGFEVLLRNYMRALINYVPLIPERRDQVSKDNYSPDSAATAFLDVFGINIRRGIDDDEWSLFKRFYERRHVHEHNGGVVDKRYLDNTQDSSVRIGQRIQESVGEVNNLASIALKSAKNLHDGFHKIFPPKPEPIEHFRAKQERRGEDQ